MLRFLSKKRIYLDHASTTPLDREVLRTMLPYFSKDFGNAGSIHTEGRVAKDAIEVARKRIAQILGAHTNEIIFTSSGTESNNLAIRGAVRSCGAPSPHVITTVIEHPSVLEPVRALEQGGASVTYIGVDREGRVDIKQLREALRGDTVLVSIMLVNNEVGSIQPLRDVMKMVRKHRKEFGSSLPYVHVDASQAPLFLPLLMEKLGVDLMTLDAQKLYGPKGVGLLYKRRGVKLTPIILGGGQEEGLRSGTENTPLIIGMAKALELVETRRARDNERLASLRDYFIVSIMQGVPGAILNSGTEQCVASTVNISIPGLESTFMVVWLDARGIACGSRSACTSEKGEASYVLRAMGRGDDVAMSSLRFTLGRNTTRHDLDRVVSALAEMVKKLTKS